MQAFPEGGEHAPANRRKRSQASLWQRITYSESFWAYLFLTPTIIGLVGFMLGPIVAALAFSLTNWNIVDAPRWQGLGNYQTLFKERLFWIALGNTGRYMLGAIPLEMLVSLLLALALNQGLRFQALFRTLYFTPAVCSIVALALVWRLIFDVRMGILNLFLGLLGIDPVPWLMTPATAMPAVIIMSVWRGVGYPVLLWLAALQGVPQSYYDAAEVDGAGRWARFRYVTWPFLTPTTFFMLIMDCIASFQVFQETFVLTGGGPRRSTYTLVYYIYEKAFQNFSVGYACAIAYVLFFLVLILTAVQFRLQNRWVHYEVA